MHDYDITVSFAQEQIRIFLSVTYRSLQSDRNKRLLAYQGQVLVSRIKMLINEENTKAVDRIYEYAAKLSNLAA